MYAPGHFAWLGWKDVRKEEADVELHPACAEKLRRWVAEKRRIAEAAREEEMWGGGLEGFALAR